MAGEGHLGGSILESHSCGFNSRFHPYLFISFGREGLHKLEL